MQAKAGVAMQMQHWEAEQQHMAFLQQQQQQHTQLIQACLSVWPDHGLVGLVSRAHALLIMLVGR